MELTDEELRAIYGVLYDEYFYGRELMYQFTEESENVSTAMGKIDAEIKRRGL
ncbi:MAG TPA: hypothetical protein VIY48_15605 [Candidatus Paceibacterota bacterium]